MLKIAMQVINCDGSDRYFLYVICSVSARFQFIGVLSML
jgi:hypothetical protein